MIPRVLVHDVDQASPQQVPLSSSQRHHLTRVLRLDDGAPVEAFDGRGRRWAATLGRSAQGAWLELKTEQAATAESPLMIRLGQCLSSAEKMDWTIEKAVELGAQAVSPLTSLRSQIRLDAARAQRKLEHWRAIAEAACVQSGRDWLPTIDEPTALERWLSDVQEPIRLVLNPRADLSLSAWLRQPERPSGGICLLIGPESGLAEPELQAALEAGFVGVRLGPRVLRTETAGLAAIAALQALAGDF